jgi:hypothetical protein
MTYQSSLFSLVAILCGVLSGCSVTKNAQVFTNPDLAVSALEDAVASRSLAKVDALFGADGDYLLHTGDPVLDKQRGQAFVKLFEEGHRLETREDATAVLVLGKKGWPFPVPLRQTDSGWKFDAAAGEDEILTRVIGRNELTAMDSARAIYFAQKIYASADWDGDGAYRYAGRIISTPGKRDGLYWPASDDEISSPLGVAVAQATNENYTISPDGKPQPYHGYYFRLSSTPPSAGANLDPRSKPGTYWLIATPAVWGNSGVMTFASNESGWIFEKDLGEDFDPEDSSPVTVDATWTRVD